MKFNKIRKQFKQIRPEDWFIASVFPILSGIILLFQEIGFNLDWMKIPASNPKFYQFFTYIFAHSSIAHYSKNMILFIIFFVANIYLASKSDSRKKFYTSFVIVLLSLPFISYFVSRNYTNSNSPSLGFSGILMAVVGITPVILMRFLNEKLNSELINKYTLPILFTFVTLTVMFAKYQNKLWYGAYFLLFIVILFMSEIYKILQREQVITLSIFLILFVIGPFMVFPSNFNVVRGDAVDKINVFAHYIGYLYGFLVSYLNFIKN